MSISGVEPFADLSEEFGGDDGLDPTSPQPDAPGAGESDPDRKDPTRTLPQRGAAHADVGVGDGEPVEIRWQDSSPEWVSVHPEWRDLCTGPELLERVVNLVNSATGEMGDDWVFQIDLSTIPLQNLREFNALLREADHESDIAPDHPLEIRRTKHLRAVWRGHWLLEITANSQWLSRARRQALAEELSEMARMPDATLSDMTARTRLLNFLGGKHG